MITAMCKAQGVKVSDKDCVAGDRGLQGEGYELVGFGNDAGGQRAPPGQAAGGER